MSPKWKLTAYAVLAILCAWFAHRFYANYSLVTKPAPEPASVSPDETPDESANANSNNPTNVAAGTNAGAATDTNSVANSETNAASTPDTNAIATTDTNSAAATNTNATGTTETNLASTTSTNAAHKKKKAKHVANAAMSEADLSAARGSMMTYMAAFVGSLIGLGLLIAYDVTQFAGTQAVDFLFNDGGEGQRDPEYERAEAEWANGKFLDAIQLMRDFLKKNPREIYAALRIAEIYEKDLKNPLASALEYEEILKQKLPAERWGWAAIHLCNLYSKLNKSDEALALLRRIADEYPKTGAAKKARVRLGLAEPELEVAEEEPADTVETETADGRPIVSIEAHPPELEPRLPASPQLEESTEPEAPEAPKPGLPPGFRKKK